MPPLIMFDLDQTLAESKRPLTPHMAELLYHLLKETKVAIVSGGSIEQFLTQIISKLPPYTKLDNLYLLPISGAALYEWKSGKWHKVYEETLSPEDAERIKKAVRIAAEETGLVDFSKPAYGERIEYRGGQVTFSALGQEAPIEEKVLWDPDKSKRRMLHDVLTECLPQYSVCLPDFAIGMGGATSIDITKKGVDKAYGVKKLAEHVKIPEEEMLYVGDQLVPGGNDEAVFKTHIKTHAVKNPKETAFFICSLLPGTPELCT